MKAFTLFCIYDNVIHEMPTCEGKRCKWAAKKYRYRLIHHMEKKFGRLNDGCVLIRTNKQLHVMNS